MIADDIIAEVEREQAKWAKRRGIVPMYVKLPAFKYGVLRAYVAKHGKPICGGATFIGHDKDTIEVSMLP